jgi:hypothetical protein
MSKKQKNQLLIFLCFITIVLGLVIAYNIQTATPRETLVSATTTKELEFGNEPSSEIPNIIWAFWDGPPPDIVNRCMQSWKYYNPDYKIILLNKQNLSRYIPNVDIAALRHANESHTRFSDFVRLHVLAKHGGIYIDASIICHKPFSWLHAVQKKKQVDFIGYYLNGFTEPAYKAHSPVVENWFFAATPHSKFVKDWLLEFMRTNDYKTIDQYLQNVYNEEKVSIQKIEGPDYLAMHVAAQKIFQKNTNQYNVYLFEAEKGPFLYLVDAKWDSKTAIDLLTNDATHTRYFQCPFVKLRGCERPYLEKNPRRDNAFSHDAN